MARTVKEIQDSIIKDATAQGIVISDSIYSIRRLWTFVAASATWLLESLFDEHKSEVIEIISSLKPHSLRWYAEIAKKFQYGYNLPPDSDVYDNSALTSEQVDESKIIAYSAVVEGDNNLRIKVATISGGDLAPLDELQLTAFYEYMRRVKDAGVKLQITSLPPDSLKLSIDIYYNPLVLDGSGARIDGSSLTPIPDAVNAYLKNLPFNGYFVLTYLADTLQRVDGVVIPKILSASAKYGDFPYLPIDEIYNPDSGYLRVTELLLNFKPQGVIL